MATKKKVTAAKKTPAKKAVKAVSKPKAQPAIRDAFTKTQILTTIAENTELTKKQVTLVLDELSSLIERHIKTKAAGEFTMPGLMKIKVVKKPAVKARKGVNPFTGEEQMFKAKPARNALKIKPLKKLKDMAS